MQQPVCFAPSALVVNIAVQCNENLSPLRLTLVHCPRTVPRSVLSSFTQSYRVARQAWLVLTSILFPHCCDGSNLLFPWHGPLDGVIWPDALQVLSFGGFRFNQPIHVTPLPKGLQVLKLGEAFDQPLDNVVWPKGLKEVDTGWQFSGRKSPRLADVVWPSSLREMKAPMMVDMGHLPRTAFGASLMFCT